MPTNAKLIAPKKPGKSRDCPVPLGPLGALWVFVLPLLSPVFFLLMNRSLQDKPSMPRNVIGGLFILESGGATTLYCCIYIAFVLSTYDERSKKAISSIGKRVLSLAKWLPFLGAAIMLLLLVPVFISRIHLWVLGVSALNLGSNVTYYLVGREVVVTILLAVIYFHYLTVPKLTSEKDPSAYPVDSPTRK